MEEQTRLLALAIHTHVGLFELDWDESFMLAESLVAQGWRKA